MPGRSLNREIMMRSPIVGWLRLPLAACAALTLSACATMQVNSYMERGTSLAQYRTYDWGPADTSPTGDPRLDHNELVEARIRMAVERELNRRGFEKATAGTPDLMVHYHASVTQEIDVRDLDRDYAFCEQADCRPFVYDAGTLFVDLVDARTRRLAWRGWAEGSVDGVIDDQERMNARIDEAVSKILQRLPPGR